MYIKNLYMGGMHVSSKAVLPGPPRPSEPGGPDLDDLIFQDESWLASDR